MKIFSLKGKKKSKNLTIKYIKFSKLFNFPEHNENISFQITEIYNYINVKLF